MTRPLYDVEPGAPLLPGPSESDPPPVSTPTPPIAAADEPRCDACGSPVPRGDDDGFAVAGQGVYLWTRGTEVRFENVPLCPICAAAIGMTALARWEIEEEEG
jgi:hypothetical protein